MLEKISDFLTHGDILSSISKLNNPEERIIGIYSLKKYKLLFSKGIIKWYMSAFYIKPKGVKKPYNPILGEIFR